MSDDVRQRISCRRLAEDDPLALSKREWLVTNGLGGYASGTLSGAYTRRYHGLLTAALPAPLGRRVMFNHLGEEVRSLGESSARLYALDLADAESEPCPEALSEFRLEAGLPVWEFDVGKVRLEKRVLLPHRQNTVYIRYRLLAGPAGARLRLRPAFHFRPHEAPVNSGTAPQYNVVAVPQGFEVHDVVSPPLRMHVAAARSSLVLEAARIRRVHYRLERERGYESTGA